MKGVDLAECHSHPADLREQARGQRGEGQEALFHLDALLTEGEEEIGSAVRVDDRLDADFRFPQARVGQVLHLVLAGDGEEVPDHRDAGIEVVRRLAAAASRLRRWAVGRGRRGAWASRGARPSARRPDRPRGRGEELLRKGRGAGARTLRSSFNGISLRNVTGSRARFARRDDVYAAEGRRAAREGRNGRGGRRAVRARVGRRAGRRRRQEDGGGRGRQEVRDGARRARVLVLRNERSVRGMVRREELRPVREELETVDVAERPAQRQRREQGDDGGAAEKASHGAEVYASRRFGPISRGSSRGSCRRPCPARATAPSFTTP